MNLSVINPCRQFRKSEDGAMTAFGLFVTLLIVAVCGFAADYANAIRIQTYLQAAADSAGHAALIKREFSSVEDARTAGVEMARGTLPESMHGNAIQESDIQFGYWDAATNSFSIDDTSRDAVLINTSRVASRNNSISTFFLNLIGFSKWEIREQSVFEVHIPNCYLEGMVAEVGIEIQSSNTFMEPFCLHSNGWMNFSNGNNFHNGTHVSIPNLADLNADYASNNGLMDAAHKGDERVLRIVQRIQGIYDGIQNPSSRYYRDYITNSTPIVIDPKDGMDMSIWQEGRIHKYTCTKKNEAINFDSDLTLKNGVLITNCILKVSGLTLENSTLITLNTEPDSINIPSGMTIGANDNCSPGGGAQLVTMGGVSVSSKMSLHGGQIIAAGDVNFTSHADGSWGASIVSGGQIDANSHNVMRSCGGDGMEASFQAAYFRLAY